MRSCRPRAEGPEKRGRYSIGGQAKLGLADAHLGLTVIAPLRRGTEGKLKVSVHKDTYGLLPATAVFTLRSHELTGALAWNVRFEDVDAVNEATFRPTGLMERVSVFLGSGEAVSRNEIERNVKGKERSVRRRSTPSSARASLGRSLGRVEPGS